MYRIMCEWCGDIIINSRKKRFCCKLCQNRYQANNQSKSSREKKSKTMSGKGNHMYGKHHTEESRRKISDNHANFKGSNNPFYGKHHSEESRSALSRSRMLYKGENHPFYGKCHPEETRLKMSESHKEIFENYTYNPESPQESYRYEAIREYGYVCMICGQSDGMLHVHHLDGNHSNNDINNLSVLCIRCHSKVHRGRLHEIDENLTKLILENRNKLMGGTFNE